MANTYTLITSSTVGSGGAASVTLSSIPSTYTDLLIKVSARSNDIRANGGFSFYFYANGNTSNLTAKQLRGTGSSAISTNDTNNGFSTASDDTASTFGNTEMYLPNYNSSNYKSWSVDGVEETNGTVAYSSLNATLWSNTAAITSMTITPLTGNWVQYSTFYLYGISNS